MYPDALDRQKEQCGIKPNPKGGCFAHQDKIMPSKLQEEAAEWLANERGEPQADDGDLPREGQNEHDPRWE